MRLFVALRLCMTDRIDVVTYNIVDMRVWCVIVGVEYQ